jgi:hypothetical protein
MISDRRRAIGFVKPGTRAREITGIERIRSLNERIRRAQIDLTSLRWISSPRASAFFIS